MFKDIPVYYASTVADLPRYLRCPRRFPIVIFLLPPCHRYASRTSFQGKKPRVGSTAGGLLGHLSTAILCVLRANIPFPFGKESSNALRGGKCYMRTPRPALRHSSPCSTRLQGFVGGSAWRRSLSGCSMALPPPLLGTGGATGAQRQTRAGRAGRSMQRGGIFEWPCLYDETCIVLAVRGTLY